MSDVYQFHDSEAADYPFEALNIILKKYKICLFTCSCSFKNKWFQKAKLPVTLDEFMMLNNNNNTALDLSFDVLLINGYKKKNDYIKSASNFNHDISRICLCSPGAAMVF